MCLSNWARVWTTSSAAAEGVEARTSATKSAMVKSVSWPTPEITGISEAKMARATISSLKAHKSSIEPPPRARSEEHTSELQSQFHLVCRLLLEKKKKMIY